MDQQDGDAEMQEQEGLRTRTLEDPHHMISTLAPPAQIGCSSHGEEVHISGYLGDKHRVPLIVRVTMHLFIMMPRASLGEPEQALRHRAFAGS